jgi:hypothetical protein
VAAGINAGGIIVDAYVDSTKCRARIYANAAGDESWLDYSLPRDGLMREGALHARYG